MYAATVSTRHVQTSVETAKAGGSGAELGNAPSPIPHSFCGLEWGSESSSITSSPDRASVHRTRLRGGRAFGPRAARLKLGPAREGVRHHLGNAVLVNLSVTYIREGFGNCLSL